MAQPVLHQINAWDAIKSNEINFSFVGNQIFKNQVIIKNNTTNAVVYDQTQTSFQLKHIINQNSLINGVCYNIQLRVFDKDNIASAYSKVELFYCFSSPMFIISNCVQNQIVKTPSFEAILTYSQSQNELLNNYQFILYNEHQLEIMRSGILYNVDNLKYIYFGLEDKVKYFIRATGETLNHMVVDTGMMTISVQYIQPALYAMVDLQNLARQGAVKVRSNIISIVGNSNPSPPIFIDNHEVDLRDNNSWVKFDEGFEITGDFTLQLKAREIMINKIPLILSNGKHKLEIKYMQGEFKSQNSVAKGYFLLRSYNNITNYFQMSNYLNLPIEDTDNLYIWIRRINNSYEMKVINLNPEVKTIRLNGYSILDGSWILS